MTQPIIQIYTTSVCPYCVKAKAVLRRNALEYQEIDVSEDEARQALVAQSGRKTVPQIYIGSHHVDGCDDLIALESSGELQTLVAAQAAL